MNGDVPEQQLEWIAVAMLVVRLFIFTAATATAAAAAECCRAMINMWFLYASLLTIHLSGNAYVIFTDFIR